VDFLNHREEGMGFYQFLTFLILKLLSSEMNPAEITVGSFNRSSLKREARRFLEKSAILCDFLAAVYSKSCRGMGLVYLFYLCLHLIICFLLCYSADFCPTFLKSNMKPKTFGKKPID
jgi:hypothetical protein